MESSQSALLSPQDQIKVRQQIGQWMFTMMSSMSKDEFIHIVRTCLGKDGTECPLALKPFKERFLHVRKLLQQLQASTKSEKLIAILGKPFLYKISLQEQLDPDSTAGTRMILEQEKTFMDVERVDVTTRISSKKDFDSFQNAISEAVTYTERPAAQKGAAFPESTFEQSIVEAALESQREHFEKMAQLKQQQKELLLKQAQLDAEAAQMAVSSNQLQLETDSELEEGHEEEKGPRRGADPTQEVISGEKVVLKALKTDSKAERMTKEALREFNLLQAERKVVEAQVKATRPRHR